MNTPANREQYVEALQHIKAARDLLGWFVVFAADADKNLKWIVLSPETTVMHSPPGGWQ